MYMTSMLPSKVMPYLLRLAAPLMDSLIVPTTEGKTFYLNYYLVYTTTENDLLVYKLKSGRFWNDFADSS